MFLKLSWHHSCSLPLSLGLLDFYSSSASSSSSSFCSLFPSFPILSRVSSALLCCYPAALLPTPRLACKNSPSRPHPRVVPPGPKLESSLQAPNTNSPPRPETRMSLQAPNSNSPFRPPIGIVPPSPNSNTNSPSGPRTRIVPPGPNLK